MMMQLVLRCKDKRFLKGDWLLAVDNKEVTLTDSEDIIRIAFSHAEAAGRFTFPSFWESIRDLGIRADNGDIIWFVPKANNIARIKTYLDRALATQGPAAIGAIRRRGWRFVLAGSGVTGLAIFVMVASMVRAFGNPQGGEYYVTIGSMVSGLILLSRGIAALKKASRANMSLE